MKKTSEPLPPIRATSQVDDFSATSSQCASPPPDIPGASPDLKTKGSEPPPDIPALSPDLKTKGSEPLPPIRAGSQTGDVPTASSQCASPVPDVAPGDGNPPTSRPVSAASRTVLPPIPPSDQNTADSKTGEGRSEGDVAVEKNTDGDTAKENTESEPAEKEIEDDKARKNTEADTADILKQSVGADKARKNTEADTADILKQSVGADKARKNTEADTADILKQSVGADKARKNTEADTADILKQSVGADKARKNTEADTADILKQSVGADKARKNTEADTADILKQSVEADKARKNTEADTADILKQSVEADKEDNSHDVDQNLKVTDTNKGQNVGEESTDTSGGSGRLLDINSRQNDISEADDKSGDLPDDIPTVEDVRLSRRSMPLRLKPRNLSKGKERQANSMLVETRQGQFDQEKEVYDPQARASKESVTRSDITCKYPEMEQFPVRCVKEVFQPRSSIFKLDLSGTDQLTDLFFQLLRAADAKFDSLEHASFMGCVHLTDRGVQWMAETFPNLKSVNMSGCRGLTERSLSAVLTHCASVAEVTMKGCDVALVPPPTGDRREVKLGLDGCPLLSPSPQNLEAGRDVSTTSQHLKDLPPHKTMKVVVVKEQGMPLSVIESLSSGKLRTNNNLSNFCASSGYSLDTDTDLNLVECTMPYARLVSTDYAVYIFMCRVDQTYPVELATQIMTIKNQVPSAVFVVVGVSETESPKLNPTQLREKLAEQFSLKEKILADCIPEIHKRVDDEDQPMTFSQQRAAACVYPLHHSLRVTLTDGQHLFVCPATLKLKQPAGIDALRDTIKAAVGRVRELHPMYKHLPGALCQLFASLPSQPGIFPEADIVTSLREKHSSVFGSKRLFYRKALQLMHKFGWLLYIPGCHGDPGVVVTDLTWFSGIVHKLNSLKKPAKDASPEILMVHPDTDTLDPQSITDLISQQLADDNLLDSLLRGCDLAVKDPETSHLILTANLQPEPPVSVDHYISKDATVKTLRRSLLIPAGIPSDLRTSLLLQASIVHPPSVIWDRGFITQQSPVVTAVTVEDTEEGSKVEVLVQTSIPLYLPERDSSKKLFENWDEHAATLLGHSIQQYRTPIEHWLYRQSVFYKLQDPSGHIEHWLYRQSVFYKLQPLESENITSTLKDDCCSVFTGHHLARKSGEPRWLCHSCGQDSDHLQKLWNLSKEAGPGFVTPGLVSGDPAGLGSCVEVTPERPAAPRVDMSPTDFPQWTVTPVSGRNFSIAILNACELRLRTPETAVSERELFSVEIDDGVTTAYETRKITRPKKAPEPTGDDKETKPKETADNLDGTTGLEEKDTPPANQATELEKKVTPPAKQATGLEEKDTPPAKQATGLEEKDTPPAKQATGLEQKDTPPAKQVTGLEEKDTPPAKQATGLKEKDTPPAKQATGLEQKDTPPTKQATGLEQKDTPPAKQTTGLEDKDTPPAKQATGLEQKDTPPAKQATGLEQKDTPPAKQATGLEQKDTPPAKQTTGLDDKDTPPTVETETVWERVARPLGDLRLGVGDSLVVRMKQAMSYSLNECPSRENIGASAKVTKLASKYSVLYKVPTVPTEDTDDPFMVEISIELLGGDTLCTATVPLSDDWGPVLKSTGSAKAIVDHTYCQMVHDGPSKVEVGMWLEFENTQNVTLYGAHIAEMEKDGRLEIVTHDWSGLQVMTSRIRTTLADPCLHPVGFFTANPSKMAKHKFVAPGRAAAQTRAQRLRAGSRTFNWSEFLQAKGNYPVPLSLFSESQKLDTPSTVLDADTALWLTKYYQLSGAPSQVCSLASKRPHVLMRVITEQLRTKLASTTTRILLSNRKTEKVSELSQVQQEFPYVVVPGGMDRQCLLYPALRHMWQCTNDRLHLLCVYSAGKQNSKAHVVDSVSAAVPDSFRSSPDEALSFLRMKTAMMLSLYQMSQTQGYIQDRVKELVTGVQDWPHSKVERHLSPLLQMYITMTISLTTAKSFDVSPKPGGMTRLRQQPKIAEHLRESLSQVAPFTELLKEKGTVCCVMHKLCEQTDQQLTSLDLDGFVDHSHMITSLDLSKNSLQNLPEAFFPSLPSLESLDLRSNKLTALPLGIGRCPKFRRLILRDNKLCALPEDFVECRGSLTTLNLSHNRFPGIPEVLYQCTDLESLSMNHNAVTVLPSRINELTKLTFLDVRGSALTHLPDLSGLKVLKDLNVSGVRWLYSSSQKPTVNLESVTTVTNEYAIMADSKLDELFAEWDVDGSGKLSGTAFEGFNAVIRDMFPRLQTAQHISDKEREEFGWCPPQLFELTTLTVLDVSYLNLTKVTSHFKVFVNLEDLWLSHNPGLISVASELSSITTLKSIHLTDCPNLKTPPKEIVSRGFKAIVGYLKRLDVGSVECKRTKLMMVGLGGAGKTSLVRALRDSKKRGGLARPGRHDFDSHLRGRYGAKYATQGITDGIDITDWTVSDVTFSMWDFAGQTVYYNTHQFFMSNRAVYLLLWNIRLGYEHAGLDFWLSSIACHAPKAPILVIGTHCDQVEKFWLPKEELQRRYPQIVGFHAISCVSPTKGLEALTAQIVEVALQEKYMGEQIPDAWLFLEEMLKEEKKQNIVTWEHVERCAEGCGMLGKEVTEAVQFLHELGSVQHFQNIFLKSRVVINPQWIVDAMACVVSVHDTPIEEGRLKHGDIGRVWKKFDAELHPWLLRLTEEFDLTFPLKEGQANVVPCLLPAEEPKFDWPNVEDMPGCREVKMLYKFEYLPAGLFNRAQVRLYQFSDSSIIWKKGSLLRKNGHQALLKQKHNDVHLKVQGPRPGNIVFMVHEVFEGLMAESFHGVTYDYFVPCSDCIKINSNDPSLFPASKIRRATELKAPFLQCDKLFHTLSLHELHSAMPPDNSSDYDLHLERSLRDLDTLKDNLGHDVFIIYNTQDVPTEGDDKKVHPATVASDLQNNGFRVWMPPDPSTIDLHRECVAIRETKLVIVFISNKFVADPVSQRLFYFIKQNLQKKIQLVVVGDNYNWKESQIGMLCATDVYVNMMSPKRYQYKIKELIDTVKDLVNITEQDDVEEYPQVFISYCWSNSADAVNKGTRSTKEAVGYGDPRTFKDYLEQNGVRCWIDVDNVGKGSLFEEIAMGLRRAKVMLVCVSDEYCRSRNCQVEFRFAAVTLKIPMVIAVVGSGENWESTEIGMLSLGHPKVNLQYKLPNVMERLLLKVRSQLPATDDDTQPENVSVTSSSSSQNQQLAFQELLELAQRKFLRQVTIYADAMETSPYPRLLILDYQEEPTVTTDMDGDDSAGLGQEEGGGQAAMEMDPTEGTDPPEQTEETAAEVVARVTSPLMPDVQDDASDRFCVRFLCEHDEGWHETMTALPLPSVDAGDWEAFMTSVAPYMARIYAIMKHTPVALAVLDTDRGTELRKRLIDKCGLESEFEAEYTKWRKLVMDADHNQTLGGLARCHLPSGKELWLCEEHQKDDRVTVLSDDMANIDLQLPTAPKAKATSPAPEASVPKPAVAEVKDIKTSSAIPESSAAAPDDKEGTKDDTAPGSTASASSGDNGKRGTLAKRSSLLSQRDSVTSPQARKAANEQMAHGTTEGGAQKEGCVVN